MSDDTTLNPGVGGDVIVTDSLGGVPERKVQGVKIMLGGDGVDDGYVRAANPLPVTGAVTLAAGRVQGIDAHDAVLTADPVLQGGRASAAAPADVSADGDAVRAWHLRNGAAAVVLTASGALLGGDATFGLDVDVTRVSGNVTVVQATAANLKAQVQGEDAHDAAITGNPVLAGARASTATPSAVSADGDAVRLWANRLGSLKVALVDDAGDSVMDGANDAVRVSLQATGAVTLTVQDNASLVDNAAFTDGTSRVVVGGYILDEVAGTALTENDAGAARIDSKRAQVQVLEDATTRGQRLAINSGGALEAQGDVAHDAVGTGVNPLLQGGYASAAAPTDVSADGDAVRAWRLRNGAAAVVITAAGTLIAAGSGTQATALRTTLATDSPLVSSLVTEDAASAADPVGFPLMGRRRDSPVLTEVSADADNIALNATSDGSLHTRTPNRRNTGSALAATGNVDLNVEGCAAVLLTIGGGFVATIVFQGDMFDPVGANPQAIQGVNLSTKALETQTTTSGAWIIPTGGLRTLRIRVNAYTSGTVFIDYTASAAPSFLHVTDGGGALSVDGSTAHDAVATSVSPVLAGGYASAAAPTDVSADGDAVRAWRLRNGAAACVLTAAGALIGGDATNGLDVDVTRQVTTLDKTASGSISGTTSVSFAVNGCGTAAVQITGTFSATLLFEGTVDGTNWISIDSNEQSPTPGTVATGTTNNAGLWFVPCAGLTQVRVRCSAYTSGTATVTWGASSGVSVARVTDGRGALTIDGPATGIVVDGRTPVDSPVTGAPLWMGAQANSGTPSEVSANGDMQSLWADRRGALMTTERPINYGSLGIYTMSQTNGTTAMTAGIANDSPIYAFRWGSSNLALIRRIEFHAIGTATAFAAGLGRFELFAARSYTASDTGGTGITPTGNGNKRRTSMATTALTDARISATGTLTAGTRTLDANPLATILVPVGTNANSVLVPNESFLWHDDPSKHPLVLAQNEGFIIRCRVPGTGTWFFEVTVEWEELAAY